MLERYHIMPSQYLGLSPDEVDHEKERAFLLACAMTTIENEKEQAKKMQRKSKRRK